MAAFIGLKEIANAQASPFTLRDQANQNWSLSGAKGKVVVLSFYNVNCNDVCPVLGAEIREAHQLLGRDQSKVEFAVVNTDPKQISVSSQSPALREPGLSRISSLSFLTGSVQALNRVWTTYGVQVNVGAKVSEVTHNNVLYFVGANGDLDAYARPFATVTSSGHYSSSSSSIHLYAQAIAATAVSLLP